MNLKPIIAAKHSMETGTMRLFEQRFTFESPLKLDTNYDGAILYLADNYTIPQCEKPLIQVNTSNLTDLQHAVIEVVAVRDILENDKDVIDDWVARKELEERLADAEILLDRTFGNTYGDTAKWSFQKNGKAILQKGTPSKIVSRVCDTVYSQTPEMYNEMINRTMLSPQGSAAKRKLICDMIENANKPKFGIEGYGPDRAVYESIIFKNKFHVPDAKLEWILQDPTNETITPVWDEIIRLLTDSKKRVSLSQIYEMCKLPPFGIKDGILTIFIILVLLIYKNNVALYEHGTYKPNILPEIAERMIKNPEYYELKYFKSTPTKRLLLQTIIKDLKINSKGSVLDVVSHLVGVVSSLTPYVKKTKKLDKHTLAVRDTILNAIEPDTLLFESLPKALGFNSKISESDIKRFSRILVKSTNILQNEFNKILLDIQELLYDATGIDNRKKISKTASVMLKSVSDQKMKVFLNAASADVLENDDDWIKYVSLSLTDVPPADWKDEQREMFENNLVAISGKFKRLASLHFADISDNFVKPSYQVTVTHADGTEHHSIVSIREEQKIKMQDIADKILQDMRKRKLTKTDLGTLIAILTSKSQ